MKETYYNNKMEKVYTNLLALKIEIQNLENDNNKKKIKWREIGEEIRSISQSIGEKKQKLMDSITKL